MASSLYVAIRGDYSQFQKDIKRLRGIARQSAQELSDIFGNAFSKGDAQRGLTQIGSALKKLGAVANTVGAQFKPVIQELDVFAEKCGVSTAEVERLAESMGYAARQRQLESSLRTLQRQAGLTNSALAQLAQRQGLFQTAGNIASEALGVRTKGKIAEDITEAVRAFRAFKEAAVETGESTKRQFEAMKAKVREYKLELMTAAQKEEFLQRQKYNNLAATSQIVKPSNADYGQYASLAKAKEAVSAFNELKGRLPKAAEIRAIADATGATTAQVWKFRDALDRSSNAFKALIGYGQVWLTFGFAHTALGFVKTAMALENVKVAFTAIYGTSDMAEKKLEFVRQVSDQLGLSFLDTAEGAKKLFAAANGTPVEREANKVFRAFSNMSAAMKLTGDETKGVFLALSQMISKGKVSAEELRQQLAERMPGAVNLFAKSIGKSTQELDKMLQKGEVTLEHFLKFANAVDMTYSAGAEAAGHSLQAELNRIKNTWVEFQERMTDTGQLATLASGFNSVLKETLSIVEKIAPYMDDIATAGFAAWIGSSIASGGKLNALLGSLGSGIKKIGHNLKTFAAVSAVSAVPVGNLSKALGGLKIAMMGIVRNPALLAFFTAMAGVLALNAYQAKKAARAYADVQKGMEEKLADEAKRKAADEASSFNPDKIRESMIGDSTKALADFNKEAARAQRDVDHFLVQSQANYRAMAMNAMVEVDEGMLNSQKNAVVETQKNIEDWSSRLDAALKNKSAEQAADVLKEIKEQSGSLLNQLKASGVDNSVFQILDRQISSLDSNASKLFINLTKWGDTFSAETTSAAKRLGVDLAELDKQFGKLHDRAAKTDFGKALNSLKDMDKVREIMNDTTMAYDANAAAMAGQLTEMKGYVDMLGNIGQKYDEHNDKLMEMMMGFDGSDEAMEKIRLKEEELIGEHSLLNTETDNVALAIARLAATAGGSDAQMNIMIQALNAAKEQGRITVEVYESLIGKVYELFGAAQTLSIAAAGAAHISMMDSQMAGAEANAIFKKGGQNARSSYIVKRAQQDIAAGKTSKGEEAYGYEYDTKKKIQAINDSLKPPKKGGRGGKGGGKRPDTTAEKYDSSFEGFRKEIAKLQGEVDKVTLDKKFADMDKALKGSSHNIKELKEEYFQAFSTNKVQEMQKEILQLSGNTAALKQLEIDDYMKGVYAEIEGITKAAKDLGKEAPAGLDQLAEKLKKLKENEAREEQLSKELPYYEKFTWFDGVRSEALAKQNELIAIQAEKMAETLPQELVDRWRELEELQNRVQNGNDVLAGISLGAKKYALELGNMAEGVSGLVSKAFDGMTDAFTDFVMTGKLSFTDLANSIIKDLMRIAIQQAIVGPIANGLGSLFSSFGGGSFMSKAGSFASSAASSFSGVSKAAGAVGGVASSLALAYGGVLSGLHGFSNSIVDRPTLFSYGSQLTKFAKGGVMGEAGPEAVMPLMRTASGYLGVRSEGSNAPVVNVVINNSTGQKARQQTKTDNHGNKSIEVMIGDMAAQQMMKTGTALNKAARSFSGVSQQVTRR